MAGDRTRFVTLWRKPDSPIDWDFYVSEDEREASTVVANLRKRKVWQASTYHLGPVCENLCIKDERS